VPCDFALDRAAADLDADVEKGLTDGFAAVTFGVEPHDLAGVRARLAGASAGCASRGQLHSDRSFACDPFWEGFSDRTSMKSR
jgi:hypothetical protein